METTRLGNGAAAVAVTSHPPPAGRNPGPNWGYRALILCERWMPGPVFRVAFWLGTQVGTLSMPRQRRESAAFLGRVRGRKARFSEVMAHFYTFSSSLLKVLLVARGRPLSIRFGPGGEADFDAITQRPGPVLYGTFHLGDGDLLGYFLTRFGRRIRMVRLRMANSDETRWMEEQFGETVQFIWVDKPENMLFALREAIEEGHSIAMKCDRVEGARKVEWFDFLGARRPFPFTIYWLSLLFEVPVVFSFGVSVGPGETEVYCCPSFQPDPALGRRENLVRARAHFAEVLQVVEGLLQRDPTLWFNFEPWTGGLAEGGVA